MVSAQQILPSIQLNGWGLRCATLAASTQLTWVWRAFDHRVSSSLWATVWWFRSQTGTYPDSGNSQKRGTSSTCNSCPAWSLKELQGKHTNTYFSNALFSSLSASFLCQALCFLTRVSHKALTTEISNTTTLCPIFRAWNYLFKKNMSVSQKKIVFTWTLKWNMNESIILRNDEMPCYLQDSSWLMFLISDSTTYKSKFGTHPGVISSKRHSRLPTLQLNCRFLSLMTPHSIEFTSIYLPNSLQHTQG